MSEAELFRDRQCHKCQERFNISAAALRLHVGFCPGAKASEIVGEVVDPASGRVPKFFRVPSMAAKMSNRKRQKMAIYAMAREAEHKFLLLAVLAQKGGEVTITHGTVSQLTDEMSYEVVPNPVDATERIVRILK